ncbi:hypothetical protein COPEUT_02553 [Coprococcus eutactus ATCC 27759]|nr:hypothetical protein COPEUT_02553 [Coprococcus eutactus ATCC 27759]
MKNNIIHKNNYFEGVVTMMSLSDTVNGFSGEIAWNCADRSLFGACQLETGDQVQVVSSYFGNVIIKVKGKRLAITRDAAERIKLA